MPENHDRQACRLLSQPDLPARLQAVEARRHSVEHGHVEGLLAQRAEGLGPMSDGCHSESLPRPHGGARASFRASIAPTAAPWLATPGDRFY